MAKTLGFSDRESKIIMINMLRTLVGKVGNMSEQMGNIRRDTNQRDGNSKK